MNTTKVTQSTKPTLQTQSRKCFNPLLYFIFILKHANIFQHKSPSRTKHVSYQRFEEEKNIS